MAKISKNDIQKLQVSSVVGKDKNFGKQNIFDGSDETCWSSDEGKPQWIALELKESQLITSFSIQFQGGFVGRNCRVDLINGASESASEMFYPNDVNSVQKFSLSKPMKCKKIKFVFEESTDFFGRIIVYFVDIFVE